MIGGPNGAGKTTSAMAAKTLNKFFLLIPELLQILCNVKNYLEKDGDVYISAFDMKDRAIKK
jgi:hypothetical protein